MLNVGDSQYKELLDTWFPEGGSPPSAFLLDTSEEALLLPDWLKLRMIRSHVLQLVDVGRFSVLSALIAYSCHGVP